MDPTTKGNILVFLAAMLVIGTFWLVLLGLLGGNLVQFALGVGCGVAAAAAIRAYTAHIRQR